MRGNSVMITSKKRLSISKNDNNCNKSSMDDLLVVAGGVVKARPIFVMCLTQSAGFCCAKTIIYHVGFL